ncbi:MAG: alanine racemase [Candidatus Cloacimonetes bacterium]|jgi:alanine racemase|nr:alanine racemase [Candidatus Cloacimonadota bacterium]
MELHERSWVEIDLAAFRENLSFLKSFLSEDQGFLQVVKADAYGHGAKEIANAALAEGAKYLGVANLDEGSILRRQDIKAPILILSPSLPQEAQAIVENGLTPSVSDLQFARLLDEEAKKLGVVQAIHIKLDTGMHRSGIRLEDAGAFLAEIARFKHLEIEGIFSHFSAAEDDENFSHAQEEGFTQLIRSLAILPKYIHLANSSALIKGYASACNLVRFGIMSFGIDVIGNLQDKLLPVMSFKSTLTQVKRIKKGEYVGYKLSWQAQQDGLYGIIPVGYADGYDFMLSNKAVVEIVGKTCPIIGRISMDMSTVDLSTLPNVLPDEELCLLGGKCKETRAENLSALYGGSPYELLCQVGRRAKRYYLMKEQVLHSAPLARRDFIASDFADSKLSRIISQALSARLRSEEIGEMVYREILRTLIFNQDRDVHYRRNFRHLVRFGEVNDDGYYPAETVLSYHKVLDSDYFIVACAASDEALRSYFLRDDVEYRWLLDSGLDLGEDTFEISSVKVGGISLHTEIHGGDGFLEIRCHHPELAKLKGKEQIFEIKTKTFYPADSHQFSVFISDLTRSVEIVFEYPQSLGKVEPVSIFSGQEKNPVISFEDGRICLKTKDDQWVFPLSGVVFTY